jgi:hypothetical protein
MDPNTDTKTKPGDKAAAADAGPLKVAALQADRWQLGEFLNARHAVTLPAGVPFENIKRPEFWANIVRIKPDDIIEVRTDDRRFYAELIVLARGRNWATVAVIREPVELKAASLPPSETSAYKTEYSGSHAQWRVLRLSDNAVVKEKLPTEQAAMQWVANQEKALAH